MGTLFDLAPLRERLGPLTLEAWFERLLHSAATLSLVGDWVPFDELAASTLETTAAKLELEIETDDVLSDLGRLPPYPDARETLERLCSLGHPACILTNGGLDATRRLVEGAGLEELVAEVFSVETVRAYKPHPTPYLHVVEHFGSPAYAVQLVAAHAWDVLGAKAAGLNAVWVNREERAWPFAGVHHHEEAPDLATAILV